MKNKIKIMLVIIISIITLLGIILNISYISYLNKAEAICKSKLSSRARGYECDLSQMNFEVGKYKTFPEWFKSQLKIK